MDDKRFDSLTRTFASDTDRRSVLKRLLGGALGGSLALAGRGASARSGKTRGDKVWVCHATGSKTNPYVLIHVSTNATKQGHGGHEDDLIPAPTDGQGKPYCPSGNGGCGDGEKPCGDDCIPEDECCTKGKPGCPDGATCESGTCQPDDNGGCGDGEKPCGSACIGEDECCTEGEKGCPDGEVCESGTCVPDDGDGGGGGLGDPCDGVDDCQRPLRCCGHKGGQAVCTRVVCESGYRPQGGYPNGPRCECCGNGTCSTRFIKRLVRR